MSETRRYFLDRVMEDERKSELLAEIIADWQDRIAMMRNFLGGNTFDDDNGPRPSSFRESPESTATKNVTALTDVFLKAAERGDALTVLAFVLEEFPVNFRDEKTGETALHIAAGCDARDVIRVLIETGKCNYLLRDRRGRLASELAYLVADNPATARLLGIKEKGQAKSEGIKLTRRPTPAT